MNFKELAYVSKASYKGVEFIFSESSLAGGRKLALRQFPNADLQSAEDLGQKIRGFNVTGLVALVGDETNYIDKRNKIVAAFESKGAGIFVHPLHGIIPNVKVASYTLSENLSSVGFGNLSIEFVIDNFNGDLKADSVSNAEILVNTKKFAGSVATSINNDFAVNPKLLGVYNDAKSKVAAIGNAMKESIRFAQKTTAGINKLSADIASFQKDITALAGAPMKLSNAIVNVFNSLNANIANADSAFESFKSFFSFGFVSDITLRFDTVANRARNKNNRTLNYAINSMALSYAYYAASNKSYKTVDEIDGVILVLENQFDFVRSKTVGDSDLLFELMSHREALLSYLDNEKQRASKLITIDVTNISARALSYLYYGDDSQAFDIARLNPGNGLIFNGPVKVFTK